MTWDLDIAIGVYCFALATAAFGYSVFRLRAQARAEQKCHTFTNSSSKVKCASWVPVFDFCPQCQEASVHGHVQLTAPVEVVLDCKECGWEYRWKEGVTKDA